MGWISAIKGFLGGGSADGGDQVMKVASGIGGWIDGQQFTDQEKAEFRGKVLEQYSDYLSSTVSENTARSRPRRIIAIMIIRFELAFLTASALLFKLDPAWSKYLFQIATEDPMNFLVLGVGAFFFSAHLIRAAQGGKNG